MKTKTTENINKFGGLHFSAFSISGENGIRTHGTLLKHTRFPSVPLKPLEHLSFSYAMLSTSYLFYLQYALSICAPIGFPSSAAFCHSLHASLFRFNRYFACPRFKYELANLSFNVIALL